MFVFANSELQLYSFILDFIFVNYNYKAYNDDIKELSEL